MFKAKGIVVPIISPMDKKGNFNEKVYCDLIDHLIKSGVHGIFPFGTTGEFYSFTNEQVEHILKLTMEHVNGRVDVYAGANSITTKNVIDLVKIAEKAKVDAVSVLTTMFVSQTQDEVYKFYKSVADSTDLPVIIYNNKPKTNVDVTPGTIAKLAQIENIIAVKDSTGDMTNSAEYIRQTENIDNFDVLIGRDTLIYGGLCYGAKGAIASCANVAPALIADIYNKYMAGDLKGSLKAQYTLAPLRIACGMGTFPQVIKESLQILGFDVGNCLPPIQKLSGAENKKLREILTNMGLLK